MIAEKHYDDVLLKLVQEGISDFLTSTGIGQFSVKLCHRALQANVLSMLGVVSFSGEKLRGTVAVQADSDFLLRTDPLQRKEHSQQQQVEWLAEMANRVVGAIKGRFVQRGVNFGLGLPAVAKGNDVVLAGLKAAPIQAFCLQSGSATCLLFFSAALAGAVTFDAESDPDSLIGAAGDGIVF